MVPRIANDGIKEKTRQRNLPTMKEKTQSTDERSTKRPELRHQRRKKRYQLQTKAGILLVMYKLGICITGTNK
ncbi:278_t:CDS:2 [Cetraspora pellucida]|uniref:278_t:CDS:1 n=1 Tax=Cetraspora pellucida TaxID=1433469 RepID=A0ACA9N775_9GLOM|nr:278_t:CDS:2 [Cetraspora pellucida]